MRFKVIGLRKRWNVYASVVGHDCRDISSAFLIYNQCVMSIYRRYVPTIYRVLLQHLHRRLSVDTLDVTWRFSTPRRDYNRWTYLTVCYRIYRWTVGCKYLSACCQELVSYDMCFCLCRRNHHSWYSRHSLLCMTLIHDLCKCLHHPRVKYRQRG